MITEKDCFKKDLYVFRVAIITLTDILWVLVKMEIYEECENKRFIEKEEKRESDKKKKVELRLHEFTKYQVQNSMSRTSS